MSKYSLQTECLENIEAFSDEHINREMAVIESVIDIFDKTILMMELSNNDVDVPDCSMFMESTFFQEVETPATGNTGQNNTQTTTGDNNNNQKTNNNSQNNSGKGAKVTDAPKEYNKDHHFRKANKEGKLENVFISILLFIPRLLTLPFKLIVNAIKNHKSNGEAAKKAESATPDEKQKVVDSIKNGNGEDGVTVDENGNLLASDSSGNNDVVVTFDVETASFNMPQSDIGVPMTDLMKNIQNLNNGNLTSPQQLVQSPAQTPQQPNQQVVKAVNWDKVRADFIKRAEQYKSELQQAINNINQTIENLKNNNVAGVDVRKPLAARRSDLKALKAHVTNVDNMLNDFQRKSKLSDKILDKFNAQLDKIRNDSTNDVANANAKAAQNSQQLARNNAESLSNLPLSGGFVI